MQDQDLTVAEYYDRHAADGRAVVRFKRSDPSEPLCWLVRFSAERFVLVDDIAIAWLGWVGYVAEVAPETTVSAAVAEWLAQCAKLRERLRRSSLAATKGRSPLGEVRVA